MAPGLGYDEQGSLAAYFALTILSLLLVPATLWWATSKSSSPKGSSKITNALAIPSATRAQHRQRIFGKPRRKVNGLSKKTLALLAGWVAVAFLSYRVVNSESVQQILYNPYEILNIKESLTEKEIKRAYKKLSLKFHPDKIKFNENNTRADAENKFVEITKAYKALTDEVTRENWLQHGNPDGPQQREDVVAIPKWVIEGKNGMWILAAYGALFGGLLPYLVGKWWFGARIFTKDGALNATAATFFRRLEDTTTLAELISLVADASELGGPRKTKKAEDVEQLVKARAHELGVEGVMTGKFETPENRRSAALLWSHLLRAELPDTGAREERAALLLVLEPILTSLLNVSLAHSWLDTSRIIMHLHGLLAQGTLPFLPKLLQLPNVSFEQAKKAEDSPDLIRKSDPIRAWAWLSDTQRKAALPELDAQALQQTVDVAKKWPRLEVIDAKFKVLGEKTVSPSSIVQIIFKLRLSTAEASTPIAASRPITDDFAADIDQADDEPEELKKVRVERQKLTSPTTAYTPYWPEDKPLKFWCMVGDLKNDRIIVQPVMLPNLELEKEESVTIQFQAPQGPGLYTFQAIFISDSLVDSEVRRGLKLHVTEPIAPPPEDEDDISDPEEDSLAGQLAAMKGERVKRAPAVNDDNDDEESGTDDDEQDSSEDESSSDEEGPKGRKRDDSSDSDSD